MNIIFDILASLKISHSYYTDGHSRDFEIFLPIDTQFQLKNLKILPKIKDRILYLLAEKNKTDFLIKPTLDTYIYIGLRLTNSFMLNYTKPLTVDKEGQILFWETETGNNILQKKSYNLCNRFYSYQIQSTDRPLILQVNDEADKEIDNTTIPKADAGKPEINTFTFDLKNSSNGYYQVSGDAVDEQFFRHDELASAGCFGIVKINLLPFYSTKADLEIKFEPLSSKWSYYVVANSGTDLAKLNVVDDWKDTDTETRSKISFDKITKSEFATKLDPDTELTAGKIGVSEDVLVVFRSLTEVSRKEISYKSIKLMRNGDVLINNLPNPSTDKSTTEIIIYL